jgi:hypothetical protein
VTVPNVGRNEGNLGTVRTINNSKPLRVIFFTIPVILSVLPVQPCSRSASRAAIGRARNFSIHCSFPLAAFSERKMWGAIQGSMSDQQLTDTKQWMKKRRGQRIELSVPVVVHRPPKEGPQFSERAQTLGCQRAWCVDVLSGKSNA